LQTVVGKGLKKFRTKSTAGSQAFHSTETNFAFMREDPQRDPSIILIHDSDCGRATLADQPKTTLPKNLGTATGELF
jgi:hypothetical protein